MQAGKHRSAIDQLIMQPQTYKSTNDYFQARYNKGIEPRTISLLEQLELYQENSRLAMAPRHKEAL